GDMDTEHFGGNSNWRGPVWLPVNFLLIEALREYHRYYGDTFRIECPTGSGRLTDLGSVAHELAERLGSLFVPREGRPRACHGSFARYADDPHWRDYVLFYEYFDGDTGRGLGASHQTGWTALVACLLEDCARGREGARVVINGRTEASVSAARSEVLGSVPDATVEGFAGDLATAEAAELLGAKVPAVDILVNNLGIFEPKPFEQIPDDDWRRF